MMIIIAYIISIILWPIITVLGTLIISILLMPLFDVLNLITLYLKHSTKPKHINGIIDENPVEDTFDKLQAKTSFFWSDIFQAISSGMTQIITVLVCKVIFSIFELQATRWLAIPLGIWCFLWINIIQKPVSGRMGLHVIRSQEIGMIVGLIIAIIFLL